MQVRGRGGPGQRSVGAATVGAATNTIPACGVRVISDLSAKLESVMVTHARVYFALCSLHMHVMTGYVHTVCPQLYTPNSMRACEAHVAARHPPNPTDASCQG